MAVAGPTTFCFLVFFHLSGELFTFTSVASKSFNWDYMIYDACYYDDIKRYIMNQMKITT